MKRAAARPRIEVSADGTGIICRAGADALMHTVRATSLDRDLSQALERWRAPRAVHDLGKIIADLGRSRWPSAGKGPQALPIVWSVERTGSVGGPPSRLTALTHCEGHCMTLEVD